MAAALATRGLVPERPPLSPPQPRRPNSGTHPKATTAAVLNVWASSRSLPSTINIVVVGAPRSGKCTIVNMYTNKRQVPRQTTSAGSPDIMNGVYLDVTTREFEGGRRRVKLWRCKGDLTLRDFDPSLTREFVTSTAAGAAIVVDATDLSGLARAMAIKSTMQQDMPTILIVNKVDSVGEERLCALQRGLAGYVKQNGFCGWALTSEDDPVSIEFAVNSLLLAVCLPHTSSSLGQAFADSIEVDGLGQSEHAADVPFEAMSLSGAGMSAACLTERVLNNTLGTLERLLLRPVPTSPYLETAHPHNGRACPQGFALDTAPHETPPAVGSQVPVTPAGENIAAVIATLDWRDFSKIKPRHQHSRLPSWMTDYAEAEPGCSTPRHLRTASGPSLDVVRAVAAATLHDAGVYMSKTMRVRGGEKNHPPAKSVEFVGCGDDLPDPALVCHTQGSSSNRSSMMSFGGRQPSWWTNSTNGTIRSRRANRHRRSGSLELPSEQWKHWDELTPRRAWHLSAGERGPSDGGGEQDPSGAAPLWSGGAVERYHHRRSASWSGAHRRGLRGASPAFPLAVSAPSSGEYLYPATMPHPDGRRATAAHSTRHRPVRGFLRPSRVVSSVLRRTGRTIAGFIQNHGRHEVKKD